MNSGRNNWTLVGIGLLLAAAAVLLLSGGANATQTGDQYAGSGNWVISQVSSVSDETIVVYGDIIVQNTFTVTNAQIRFGVANATFYVNAPSSGLIMAPGTGSTSVGTTSSSFYWYFIIQNTTSNVNIQNVSFDHTVQGVQVTGGSASSRYFAHITMTNARTTGFRLTDSFATLLRLNSTLEATPVVQRIELANYINYTQNITYPKMGYTFAYRYIYDYWTVSATGVNVTRGGPWVDGIEVHAPSTTSRIDILMTGGLDQFYDYRNYYKAGCAPDVWWDYFYWVNYTYHYVYPTVEFYGLQASDTRFAYFADVRPPSESVFFDVHYNIQGRYHIEQDFCDVNPDYLYDFPDGAYSFNQLRWYSAIVVGVHVRNGGLGNSFTNLDATMGRAGVTITSDWNGAAVYQNAWRTSYATFPSILTFAFWSEERYSLTTPAAVTNTDFTLTNSRVSGAGMRFDRTYVYSPTSATVFRGAVLIDNISVSDVSGLGLYVNVSADSTSSRPTFDYIAQVSNSTFQGARAFGLGLPNAITKASDYTANVLIENNRFQDVNMTPDSMITSQIGISPCTNAQAYRYYFSTYNGIVSLDTGTHCRNMNSDMYKVDVMVRNNVWDNATGPLFGWEYSDFTFAGGSSLTFEDNTFNRVSYYTTANSPNPFVTDAMIKTVADRIVFRGNTFTDVNVVLGLLGGSQWGNSPTTPAYYGFAYCSYLLSQSAIYEYYGVYGCSFHSKTPTIIVEGNTFSDVRTPTVAYDLRSIFPIAGHANMTFVDNTIVDSKATFIMAHLSFFSIKYSVEDIQIEFARNTITNQTGAPVITYYDPYKAGNLVRMTDNVYRDSNQPLFAWGWGYYTTIIPQYQPVENLIPIQLLRNEFYNLSLGGKGAVQLTGRVVMSNNTWDGLVGWAAIIERMSLIPPIAGNSIQNATNGYWLVPVAASGLRPTGTFTDLVIRVADTAIRMVGGNLILQRMDFTGAQTAVHMQNGFAEIYSSKILILSGRVQGDASITTYNNIGYSLRWADATGVDSGVRLANGLVVTSTPDHRILNSARTDNQGLIAPRLVQVWRLLSLGTTQLSENYLPLDILISAGGLTERVMLPSLAPGEQLTYFEDYPAYQILIRDPIIPRISVG